MVIEDKNRTTLIIAVVIMFVGVTANSMVFYGLLQQALDNQDRNNEQLIAGQNKANVRGNITTDLILSSINETRDLQANLTAEDDARGEQFVKYLEAESEDTDEELDDIRNITLAIVDHLNITIPNETRDDHIIFDNGIISFDNGTKIGLANVFGEPQPEPEPQSGISEQLQNLNNKVNELFMAKNANEPATHVFNKSEAP